MIYSLFFEDLSIYQLGWAFWVDASKRVLIMTFSEAPTLTRAVRIFVRYDQWKCLIGWFLIWRFKTDEGCRFKLKDRNLPQEPWDIESIKPSLIQVYHVMIIITGMIPIIQDKICPYFQIKSWMETAQIVFCPYNYLLNPFIRKSVPPFAIMHVFIQSFSLADEHIS